MAYVYAPPKIVSSDVGVSLDVGGSRNVGVSCNMDGFGRLG